MHENILKYDHPARNFNEALPIGNGSLGAMVWGQYPTEKLTLNQDTLWSGEPHCYVRKGAYDAYAEAVRATDRGDIPAAEKAIEEGFVGPFTASYLPMGTLYFDLDPSGAGDYCRKLDMANGIALSSCSGIALEHLASFDHRCIASHLSFSKASAVRIRLESQLKCEIVATEDRILLRGECPASVKENCLPSYNGRGIRFATVVMICTDGVVLAEGGTLAVQNAHYADVFLTCETSYIDHRNISGSNYEALALAEAKACITLGYHAIKQDQAAYYRKHYGAVELCIEEHTSLADTESRLLAKSKDLGLVEALFNFGRYLTIASSAKGSQATNLQGIWNEALCAIWKSNYTVNINTEMNYWQTLMCGLPDFHLPVVELVKKIADTGSVTAKEFYHAGGFVCHHNVDLWGNTVAVGGAGEEFIPGNSNFSFWCGASGWLCRNVFEYYEYTLDQEFLREVAYPLLKAAAAFYLDILRPVGDRLAVSPATSPENQYYLNGALHAMSAWTAMMQSIVEDLFRNCVTCCDILGVDAEWKAELERVIPRLMPFVVDPEGRLLEWDEEKEERDREHRHVSHLYGLYPAELITTERTPELAEACKRVLETRGDEGTGWSLAWKACLWAKLKDGDHALRLILRQLDVIDSAHTSCELWGGGTYPNLFCAHPPFQIDGNFGITAAIAMLFLQCEDAKIKILPALPKAFSNGLVKGLVAKGNIKVDIAWQNGIATKVCLQSPISQTVSLLVNGTLQTIRLESDRAYQYRYE